MHDPDADRFLGKSKYAEFDEIVRLTSRMKEHEIRALYAKTFGTLARVSAPVWILTMAIEYHALRKGQIRVDGVASPKVQRRYEMAKALDVRGLRRESDFLVGAQETGGMQMSKQKEERFGKERRGARITAGSVLINILGLEAVPADEKIIEQVRKDTGSDKFDERQLAWYKWKFRQGRLKGQDGKSHVISQGSPLKEKQAKKKKAVVVVKKKKK